MYKTLRYIRITVSVVFLVLLTWTIADAAFSLTSFGQWIMKVQLVPAILAGSIVWLVVWMLTTITFGRVYCSTVCPLGTLQDCAAHLGRRFSKGAAKRYKYDTPYDTLRFIVPLVVAACLFGGLTAVVEATDPFGIYRRIVLAVLRPAAIGLGGVACAMVIAFAVCAVAWRKGRLLCNTVCPAGGLLSLLGRQPIYRVDINTDLCIHCGKCEDVCKSECINLRDCVVDNSRCVMCLNCTAICPNDAIIIRRGRYRLSTPMMQPTVSAGCSAPAQCPKMKGASITAETSDEEPQFPQKDNQGSPI